MSKNTKHPRGRIHIDRKLCIGDSNSTGVYYAYRYFTENADRGGVNDAILDSFQLMYAALGLHNHGSKEEAIRIGLRSISILQGHITYLTSTLGLDTANIFSSPGGLNKLQGSANDVPTTVNTSKDTSPITPAEQMAFDILDSFNA